MKARERTMQRQRNTRKKKSTSSQTKTFDTRKYQDIVVRFNERMIGKEFESACERLVHDILLNYESFEQVEQAPHFRGRPFDVFGYKHGYPYIIEVKS